MQNHRRSFPRELASIPEAASWLDATAAEAGIPEPAAFAMQVCLEELFSNSVRHGSRIPGLVEVEIEAAPDRARMIIEDEGPAFDITQAPALKASVSLEDVEPGGLGIVLIKGFANGLTYQRAGGRNRVTAEFALDGSTLRPAAQKDREAGHEALAALRDHLKSRPVRLCEAGEILIKQGEASETAFLLEAGSVLVYAETSYGSTPLATLHAPCMIGEIGVFANLPRTASVRAAEAVRVAPIAKAELIDFGQRSPSLLLAVIEQLGRQIDSVNKAIGLYVNALGALEKREFDARILDELKNPTPQLAEFTETFRRFADQIQEKRRHEDEMASAALIQQSMLPRPDAIEALRQSVDLCAEMRAARHVGGDFYDAFLLDNDRLAIAIGDVCGKGIPASLFMAVVVTVLRACAREGNDVAATIARANSILCRENASSMFATVFFAVLDIRTGHLQYCNCGHNPPIVISTDGQARALPGGGLPLALFQNRSFDVLSATLAPGDKVVLFTDGVTEAMNASGDEFGETRLFEALGRAGGLGASGLVGEIFSALQAFTLGVDQSDDITCLAMGRRVNASDPKS
jgi:serine phosphatase RsbU (regulator of sigma subunit)/anti-sigma regulatory factor (Ser/Thr protein kinase)